MSQVSKKRADGNIFNGHIRDIVSSAEYEVKISEFLSPLEQRMAFEVALSEGAVQRCFFWGGIPEAERRRMVILPDWMTPDHSCAPSAFDPLREEVIREVASGGADSGEIYASCVPVEIFAGAFEELEHKDYLGSVLALGLDRSVIGDIAVIDPHSAVIFADANVEDYIIQNLVKVKNDTVKVCRASLEDSFRIPREFEVLSETVMSPRLDGIVKALCKVSREEASSLVEKGEVTLNYMEETRCDKTVENGDVISVRGHGKFIYDGDRGVNRRGRLRIDARKYV